MFFIVGIFIVGIVSGFLKSLGYFPAIGLRTITLQYYKDILSSPSFLRALRFSFYTAFTSSLVAVVLGVLFSYLLLYSRGGKIGHLINLYKIPIIVPHTIAALLTFILFTQSGWIARLMYQLGFIESMADFTPLIFDRRGFGVIFAYVWKGFPFITLVTYDILKSVEGKYAKIAANLGANHFQVFRYILFPLIVPTITTGFIIIFAFSFGAFEIPHLLGPSTPKALPVLSFIHYNNINLAERSYAMAINMFITLFSLIAVGLYVLTFQFIKKYNSK